jgi:hypothetical protein
MVFRLEGFTSEGFLCHSVLNFIAQLLLAALTFLTSVLITRWLGPLNNGTYNLAILIATLSFQFANLGIGASNVYFTGNRRFPLSNIVGNSLKIYKALSKRFFIFMNYGRRRVCRSRGTGISFDSLREHN